MPEAKPDVRKIATRWQDCLMICRKCSKKISGGFGPKGKTRLDKALKAALVEGKGRKANLAIMQVGCFDICPKNAVIVARGRTPETLYSVRSGTPVEDVAHALGLDRPGEEEEAASPPA